MMNARSGLCSLSVRPRSHTTKKEHNLRNDRDYLNWIASQLGIRTHQDWYHVRIAEMKKQFGPTFSKFIKKYGGCLSKALATSYPEYDWLVWNFEHSKSPKGYWDDKCNISKFIKFIEKDMNIRRVEDWYNVTTVDITSKGGRGLLAKYGNSFSKLLMEVFPHYDWKKWLFKHSPPGFWNDLANVYQYMAWMASQFNITHFSDWYRVSNEEFIEKGGFRLIMKYGNSLYRLLNSIYPEYEWKPWLFRAVPLRYWSSVQNQKTYIQWLAKELDINMDMSSQPPMGDVSDWRRLTWKDIIEKRGAGLVKKYGGSLLEMFASLYPSNDWTEAFGSHNMQANKYKSQMTVAQHLQKIFPNDNIHVNYKHPSMQFAKSGRSMEFDIFLPAKNLAFEYQGEQHYRLTPVLGQLAVIQERDNEKKEACLKERITLIHIPYWWDRSIHSLLATIAMHRPDLKDLSLEPHIQPIPRVPPLKETRRQSRAFASNIQLLLASVYDPKIDPTGWWMSEKYDGIRAYWDPSLGMFLSRNLIGLSIPPDVIQQLNLPPHPLDGEIWFGYNTITESMRIVQGAKPETIPWESIKFVVFDAPFYSGTFEERYKFLQDILQPLEAGGRVLAAPMVKCTSREHLDQFYASTLASGGEGVMLRQPGSAYCSGRSPTLLKLKPHKDAEAVVIQTSPHNQHWECKLSSGIIFPAMIKSRLRNKLSVGSVVTFHHNGFFMNGRPRRPCIVSLRDEISPHQLLLDYYHYALREGHGGVCYCCQSPLPLLRVQVHVAKPLEGSTIDLLHSAELCTRLECLTSMNHRVDFPAFRGCLVVPSNLEGKYTVPGVTLLSPATYFKRQ